MLKPAMEIVSESWHLYKNNWKKFVPFLILLLSPPLVLKILGTSALYLQIYLPQTSIASSMLIIVIYIAGAILTMLTSIALTCAITSTFLNQPFDWKSTLSTSTKLILPVIWTAFLVGIALTGILLLPVILGLILLFWKNALIFTIPLFVIVGIIAFILAIKFIVSFNFTFYTTIFNGARGINALRASTSLVVGRWWRILWRIFLPSLIFIILNFLIIMIVFIILNAIPFPITFLKSAIISLSLSLVNIIMTPLVIGSGIILYQNAKQTPITADNTPRL